MGRSRSLDLLETGVTQTTWIHIGGTRGSRLIDKSSIHDQDLPIPRTGVREPRGIRLGLDKPTTGVRDVLSKIRGWGPPT